MNIRYGLLRILLTLLVLSSVPVLAEQTGTAETAADGSAGQSQPADASASGPAGEGQAPSAVSADGTVEQVLRILGVEADQVEYNPQTKEFTATGNARILREGMTLNADTIRYNQETGGLLAEGHAVYEDGEIVLSAESIQVNLQTRLGEASGDARIFAKSQEVYVRGDRIERLSEDSYRVTRCTMTTCEGDDPAWSFESSDADFTYGQSVSGRNVRFKVRSLPVFYSPYFWFPALTQRQSGFLIPAIGSSSEMGNIATIRYYWMMAANYDALFRLDYYSDRGIGTGAHFRYMPGRHEDGEIWVYSLNDRETHQKYFETKLRHDQSFGRGGRLGLDLRGTSENDFYQEFADERQERVTRYLSSTAVLQWQEDAWRLYATGVSLKNLEFNGWENSARSIEVGGRGFLHPVSGLPLYLTVEGGARTFYADDSKPDERLTFQPMLMGLFKLPMLVIRPELTYLRSAYRLGDWDVDEAAREVFREETKVATTFYRAFGESTHYIEPSVTHRYQQSYGHDVPVLDGQELERDGNTATLALANRLVRKGKEWLDFEVSAVYDFKPDRGRVWNDLRSNLFVRMEPFRLTSEISYDPNDNYVREFKVDAGYRPSEGNFVVVGHRFASKPEDGGDPVRTKDVYTFDVGFKPTARLGLRAQYWYDTIKDGRQEMKLAAVYTWQCWGIELTVSEKERTTDRGTRDETRTLLNLTFKGMSDFGRTPG